MSSLPTNPTGELAFPTITSNASTRPAEVEREVLAFFDEFRNPLLRYVLSIGLAVEDGEEIIQEVFLALFRHLHAGKSRHNLRGWIFRVAHNMALKQRHADLNSREIIAADPADIEKQLDPGPNPEEEVSFSQEQRRLRAVFQALPEADRRCLRLRAEGLRYRSIAAVLGMSLGAVSMSLTRSLSRLIVVDRTQAHAE